MSHRFVVDPNSRCIAVIWHGPVTADATRAYFHAIAELSLFPERRGVLHDFRDADITVALDEMAVARRLQRQVRPDDTPARRLAAIAKSAYQFGQLRQAFAKMEMDDDILVTYSEAEARAHVGLPDHVALSDGAPGAAT
jgi:hypothetical protein